MKIIWEFTLPKESVDHQLALNGKSYYSLINSISTLIRQKLKYEDLSEEKVQILEEIRDLINERMTELNPEIND